MHIIKVLRLNVILNVDIIYSYFLLRFYYITKI